ncbi:hypothetical protein ABIA32_000432 [Streptacidiphilus sp. MAP12-20]|uniref:hypothetical protein n=1 Tax=Streptacidiphilus sp. MAP12-20 TaxID=3156299 RepID=UPI003512A76C
MRVFRHWWFLRLLRRAENAQASAAGQSSAERRSTREQQELLLREWEVMRDRLAGLAAERVAAAGDVMRAAEVELAPEEQAARRHYEWAIQAYQAAGKLLDEAADLPDLAAAVVLAERAVERLVATHAQHEHVRLEGGTTRCFYNPLHGPARSGAVQPPHGKRRQRPRTGRLDAAADRFPACRSCRDAIHAGQTPDVLPALLEVDRGWGRRRIRVLVPYFEVPQQWSLWSVTGCGAYDDTTPAQVLRGEHRRRVQPRRSKRALG